jgi:membrane fusion protein (multidrug efflux system)
MAEDKAEPAAADPAPPPEPLPPASKSRRGRRFLLLVVLPAVVLLGGLYWYLVTGRYVATDNAYVKASIVAVSADIDGRVIAVEAVENRPVAKGDLLFRLDPEPARIELDRARARAAQIRHEVAGWQAEYRQVEAEIDEAAERLAYDQQQAARQRALEARGIATQVTLEEAEFNVSAARQRLAALWEKRDTVLAKLGGDPAIDIAEHPAFLEAQAEQRAAAHDLARTEIRSPLDGTVSRMRLEPGEWVEAGEPAFTIISPTDLWIEANLKETQLTHLAPGQRVEIQVDAYPDQRWDGRVESISGATGAEFAVIPPQNASGNWVKVVQRLPVRIRLDGEAELASLRAGMTASVTIDTERETAFSRLMNQAIARVAGGTADALE